MTVRGPWRMVVHLRRVVAAACAASVALVFGATMGAQQAQVVGGTNVNMVSGTSFPDGDPFLQRQNEPSSAASTRNPLHLLAGANDYRTVDLPGTLDPLKGFEANADAWLGLFKSFDGGQTWRSTLVPGFPQDTSPAGMASPIKGRQAATDPVVRAGTNGLFYYAGVAFDRGEHKPSSIFVARFIDLNNRESGDPIAYLGTKLVAFSPSAPELDKTALAVDIPRGTATCTFQAPQTDGTTVTQTVPAGNVYVAYSAFAGEGTSTTSQIMFTRSTNCGDTWSTAISIAPGSRLNQNAQIAIDPTSGAVYVSWRAFRSGSQGDAVFVTKSTNAGATFSKPIRVAPLTPYDQGTSLTSFRTNGFQSMTIDSTGRVYIAWSERGHATLRPDPVTGDARIVVSTSTTGATWTVPVAIRTDGLGHELMPALSFQAGRLRMIYYDLREDVSQVFSQYVDEAQISTLRHTLDVYVAQAAPGAAPKFTFVRLSDYAAGFLPGSGTFQQLQFNPPNLPLFRQGTVPFMGDYLDLAPAPVFVQGTNGQWTYNTQAGGSSIAHAFWTDNRDVRPPVDGNWQNYTPVVSDSLQSHSLFDPTKIAPQCVVGHTGMRNQNIYTARVTEGLFVGSPGNTKTLGSIQRAFVVTLQNEGPVRHSYRLTIANQPPGGTASFLQFTPGTAPLTVLDVTIPEFSSVARTVFATSTTPTATIRINVAEISAPGAATPLAGGLTGSVVLNGDASNPSIQNPSIQNPSIQNPDIQIAEVFNPDITTAFVANPSIQNPSIQNTVLNPSIQNPSLQNPSLQNPSLQNDAVANPSIVNPSIQNPSIQNPSIQNPSLQNPSIQNADVVSGAVEDTTWVITNTGNTAASFAIKLVLNNQVPAGFGSQLLLSKSYSTPAAQDCTLAEQPHTILLANIPNPTFLTVQDPSIQNPSIQNPSIQNPTISLAPGESADVTLRILDPNRFDGTVFNAAAAVTPAVVAQSVNTEDAAQGITQPPVAMPLTITTAALASATPGGTYQVTLQTFANRGATTWNVTNGTLPPGLQLNATTGTISGTPTTPGNYVFTVQSTDSTNHTAVQEMSIQIDPIAPSGFNKIWNGSDNDWSNPRNWSPNGVPLSTDNVYVAAGLPIMPALNRNVTVNSIWVDPGATVTASGFVLTVLQNASAGKTIVGGTVDLAGAQSQASGTFPSLTVEGHATLLGPTTVVGNLTLGPGASLETNGLPLSVGGDLTTSAPTQTPVISATGTAASAVTVGGVNVNGLDLRNVTLRVNGGNLTRFDNVSLSNYQASGPIDQLTITHPGTAAPVAFQNVSFLDESEPGNLMVASRTGTSAPLVINMVNAAPADNSSRTITGGGAVVNWISTAGTANLVVSQTAGPAIVGSHLIYTIEVLNGGPATATNVVLTDTLPQDVSFVSATSTQGSCQISGGTVTCGLGSLPFHAAAVVTITVNVLTPTGTGRTNVVSATANEPDPAAGNNVQSLALLPQTPGSIATTSDVSITKTDSADPVPPGAAFTYTVRVHNAGPAVAQHLTVRDDAPAGITFTAALPDRGTCSVSPTLVTCSIDSLGVGEDATIVVTSVAGASPGIVTNYVLASVDRDANLTNNVAVQTTTIAAACAVPAFSSPTSIQTLSGEIFTLLSMDLDGNGTKDLVASSQAGTGVRVLLNDGAGHFTAKPTISDGAENMRGVAVADFDGDNKLDLAVVGANANNSQPRLWIMRSDGAGNFAITSTIPLTGTANSIPFIVVAGDFNEDGHPDLAVERSNFDGATILLNDGAGGFGSATVVPTGANTARIAAADLNEDGHLDLVVGHSGTATSVSVLVGDGHGAFAAPVNYTTGATPILRGVGDLNHDGHLDLIVVDRQNASDQATRLTTMLGDGHGGFAAGSIWRTANFVHTAALADVNSDGNVDLVSTTMNDNTFVVQFGDGLGNFGAPLAFGAPLFSSVAVDDFTGDGRPDVALGDDSGVVRVFPNSCGQAATDLSVTAADSPDPVAQGDIVTYTATVRNLTLTPATNVVVLASLPTGTTLVQSISDAGGTQSVSGRQVTWTLATLPGGATATFTYRVATSASGTATFTVGVTANGADSDPSNNTAVETTTVQPMIGGAVCSAPTLTGPAILPAGTTTGSADINVGDLNGDGRPDLVTSMGNANAVAVYLANASGGYGPATLYPAGTQPIDSVLVDLNGDNTFDLAIEGLTDAYVLLGNGTGGFGAPSTISFAPDIVSDVRSGDFNGDGKADLAIATIRQGQPTGGLLRILLGDGNGGFTPGTPLALNANSPRIAVGEFNGDGRADVALSFSANTAFADHVLVVLGDGAGGVASTIDVPLGQTATDGVVAALGDLNGDGFADLGVVEFNGSARQLVLLSGDGTGHFTPQALTNTAGIFRVASADMNGDGKLDLVATGSSFLGVLLNDGAGHFPNLTFFSAPVTLELRVSDLNGDGRPDVALAMQRAGVGGAAVLLNACGRASTDLALTVNDSPDPVQEGGTLTYTMTVTNNGPIAATNIALTATLPAGTVVTSVTPAAGTCAAPNGSVLACNLGTLQTGTATSVTVQITTGNGGVLGLNAGVGADQADPTAANNSVTVTTTVTAIGRTLLVTNTNDSGAGSLRQAILDSNADVGDVDRISFNIPGTGVRTIAPSTALPPMTQPAILDGTTQPGFTTSPIIELSGANIPTSGSGVGLEISNGSTVKGLVVNRFRSAGMLKAGGGSATISGNYIGTDPTGTIALPNAAGGIVMTDTSGNSINGNLISGNPTGIAIVGTDSGAFSNVIVGNLIGTDPTGTVAVPNGIGIEIFTAQQNRIGGTTAAERNVISRNTQQGIVVEGTSAGNAILGNTITGNGSLGIDLDNNGVTPNDVSDADAGGNNRQNFPVLASAIASATTTTVAGSLNSTPNATFRIELFANAACDASGNGEGQTLIGSTSVTTNASGGATFSVDGSTASGFITATATDSSNNTSEFSACLPVTGVTPFSSINTNDSGPGSLRQAILDANAAPGTVHVLSFAIPGTGVHTITLQAPLPAVTAQVVIDGTTQAGFVVGAPLIELNGNGKTGLVLDGGGSTIRGLVINGFSGDAITISSAGNTIEGNLIGTDPSGTLARPNTGHGIRITGSNNVVGGTTPAARNFIAGNLGDGVLVSGGGAANNHIVGNYIGTNASSGGMEPFEAANSLDPSDILSTQNGTVAVTTTRNHTLVGTRALELTPTGAGAHDLAAGGQIAESPSAGTITAYFYDAGPGLSSFAEVDNSVTGTSAKIGVQANDAACYKALVALGGTEVHGPNATAAGCTAETATTSIPRSVGWHKLGFRADGQNVSLFIDDQQVFVVGSTNGFDLVRFSVSGTGAGPSYSFDDLSIANIGAAILPNFDGVAISGAVGTIVGGLTAAERNVISGNANAGISVSGSTATGTVIQGNDVGLGIAGVGGFGNGIGMAISAPGVTIGGTTAASGNAIVGSATNGIAITGPGNDNTVVQGNIIGLDRVLDEFLDNWGNGIVVGSQVAGTLIGGTTPGAGNLIAFSGLADVNIGGINTTMQGNTISTDPTGNQIWAGMQGGVVLGANAANTLIGGTASGARNLITGVHGDVATALFINGHDNRVEGNYIGVNATGQTGAGNRGSGVGFATTATNNTVGGTTPGAGNVISGNLALGIALNGSSNLIAGNKIGTNAAGTLAVPNGLGGIGITNGSTGNRIGAVGAGNVISGNASTGILIDGDNVVVVGNVIGLNAAGTAALPNAAQGIFVTGNGHTARIGGSAAGEGNVVSGNSGFGIGLPSATAGGHLVKGNLVGTNAAGTAAIGNGNTGIFVASPNNTIGGSENGAGNVVSGNLANGIQLIGSAALGNIVQGNFIGTDRNNTLSLGNTQIGLDIVTSNNATVGGPGNARNVITHNQTGVQIRTGATGNILRNNVITANLLGVTINDGAVNNTIGGTGAGDGNVVQGNNGKGVAVIGATSVGNAILGNSISDNSLIGIDLAFDALTPNDAGDLDTGPNNLQNFPVLTSASVSGATTTVQGTLNSTPNTTFRLEFFSTAVCDATGNGEGTTFLGTTSVATDASGNASFNTTVGAASGIVTATATDPANNTSEFSTCRTIAGGPGSFAVTNTNDAGAGSLRQAILSANANTGTTNTITFNIPSAAPHTITLASSLPATTTQVIIDGTTAPDFAGAPVIEINGNNVASNGVTLSGGSSTIKGLVINRFIGAGIVLNGGNNVVEGNYIGIDPGGTLARSNTGAGVVINSSNNRVGGPTAAARNVISGSTNASGISMTGVTSNNIEGNYIGLNAAGTAAIPNQFDGIRMTDATNMQIGGGAPSSANVISGNTLSGIRFMGNSTGSQVQGNLIGVAANGSSAVPNGQDGVTILGGSNNTIGGTFGSTRNIIKNNTGNGVLISGASGNTIVSNEIWLNTQNGVVITSGTGNRLSNNSITANGVLGIDLGNNGATSNDLNDVDTGANNLQNFPVIGSAPMNGPSSALVTATLNSTPNTTFRVNFYGDTPCGAGLVLGTTDVTTNASGNVTFSATVFNSGIPSLSSATFVTATATDPNGNTSELSPCVRVSDTTDLSVTMTDTPDPVQVGGVVTYQATVENNGPSAGLNVVAAFAFTPGAALVETGGCPGTVTTSPGVVSCPIGTMANGATVLPFIRLMPTTANPITVVVQVTSDQGESQTANNIAQATTTVNGGQANVINTNDSGPGSLRQAILDANANSATAQTITFNIPGAGVKTIALQSALPTITGTLLLDATTQPGYVDQPLIELNGTNAGPNANGLFITGSSVIVKGFAINRFGTGGAAGALGGAGIVLQAPATNASIWGNFIGTDPSGTVALPNRGDGIWMDSGGHFIGNATPDTRNVISGNGRYGIVVVPGSTPPNGNTIFGNYVGTNRTGDAPLANFADGIAITAGSSTLLGLNVVSGNGGYGISMSGTATASQLSTNQIGTNAAGTAAIPNAAGGTFFSGPTNTVLSGNIIAFNYGNGVTINSGTGIGLLSNSIFSNGGLGIDLAPSSDSIFGSSVIDFEDQPDNISPQNTPFPTTYQGITWTNWLHYAPYPGLYQPHGVNAIFAAVDGARFTFGPRVFIGARFSRFTGAPGDIHFELYRSGTLVWTSASLADTPPQLTFLPSGFLGIVDEVRVRSLGSTMTVNGSAWIIDDLLFGNGITANDAGDADTGANTLQNFPIITSAINAAGTTTVSGTVNSTPNTGIYVEFYSNTTCNASGNGEGRTFLSFLQLVTDASGNATFSTPVGNVTGFVTATAASNNGTGLTTSEFSACRAVTGG